MAAKTGSVNACRRRFGLSRIAATAAATPCVSTRANTRMQIFAPISPGACRHGHNDARTTNRYRNVGAADPAGNIMNRVVLRTGAKMFAFGGRPCALAAHAATRGNAPAPWQRRRAA